MEDGDLLPSGESPIYPPTRPAPPPPLNPLYQPQDTPYQPPMNTLAQPPPNMFAQQESYTTQTSYLPQSSNTSGGSSGSSAPSVIIEKRPHQVILVQEGSTGCCTKKRRVTRTKGFALGGFLVLVGTAFLAVLIYDANSKRSRTDNFKEGACKTHDRVPLAIHVNTYTCTKPSCEKFCDQAFSCNQVIGRIFFSSTNQSELLQIYATYDDIQNNEGECSYTPTAECEDDTESIFTSHGAFDGSEYKCYYSTYEPRMVIMEKNRIDIDPQVTSVPIVFILVGLAVIVAVKLLGHKCGCLPYSQIKKLEEMQMQQVKQQMRPMISYTSQRS